MPAIEDPSITLLITCPLDAFKSIPLALCLSNTNKRKQNKTKLKEKGKRREERIKRVLLNKTYPMPSVLTSETSQSKEVAWGTALSRVSVRKVVAKN